MHSGGSKEPFWQQVYVNLVRGIIELQRMAPDRWVTVRDIYRSTLDPDRIERKIAEVKAPSAVRIASDDLSAQAASLVAWSWEARAGVVRTPADEALREQLTKLGTPFEVETAAAVDPTRRERLDVVR